MDRKQAISNWTKSWQTPRRCLKKSDTGVVTFVADVSKVKSAWMRRDRSVTASNKGRPRLKELFAYSANSSELGIKGDGYVNSWASSAWPEWSLRQRARTDSQAGVSNRSGMKAGRTATRLRDWIVS